ncbi:MAG: enoyl-CoA hydratase/isomerase family protein [Dehalococcoidales bacterium]|nr:enoyl-CoA hydratase/isomerase family protein [Dehalococcoidales bacterium]
MEYKNIILEKKDGITKLIVNRPPVNVINMETLREINSAIADLTSDEATKVVIIRGNGEKAFCAGIEVKDHLGDMLPQMMMEFGKLFKLLRGLGKPSIALVNGIALGGGCEIIAGCDLAIAAEGVKMGQPEIQLGGLAPAAAALFPRIMGQKKAYELILIGNSITAEQAEKIGLVNKVVPLAELDKAGEEIAKTFLSKSALSVKLVREAFYECAGSPDLTTALDKATVMGIANWLTEDGQEGLKSYLEKRPAVWKNK